MEAKNGNSQEKELEAAARNALLAHFSSKSTNETAVLIGLAVVVFADFQAYSALNLPLTWQKITFLTLSLGIITFFITRQLSRLITWGVLADAIVSVKMPSAEETQNRLGEKKVRPVRIDLDSTYLARLYVGCGLRFQDCGEQNTRTRSWDSLPFRIYDFTHNKYFVEASIVAILGILGISLMIAYVFFSFF